jgi:hypothetical protein
MVAVLLLAAVTVTVGALNHRRLAAVWEDVALDSRSTQVPCGQRPPVAEARRVLVQHRELVRRIEAVDQSVSVALDEAACPGRGTLAIDYGAHRHRERIQRLLGGETLFGIPYSLHNV